MKLQARLLLGILPAVALGVFVMGWLFYTESRRDSEEELLRQISLVVQQAERRTDSFLDTAAANARLFAASTMVEQYVRVANEEERFELLQPSLLQLFASYRMAYPNYVEIQLLLPDGYEDTRFAKRGRPNLTEEESDSDFFKGLKNNSYTTYTRFLSDADDSGPVFKIGQPIWLDDLSEDPAHNEQYLYGYLVVTASASLLKEEVIRERIGETGYYFFMDAQGTIIAHPDDDRVGTKAQQYTSLMAMDRHVSKAVDSASLSNAQPLLFEGHRSILSTTELYDNLILVSVLPEQELQAINQHIAFNIACATLATLLIKLGFFWLLLRHQVVSPIAALQRMAVAIGNGRLPVNPTYTSPRKDELGSLEMAFHEMNAKLSNNIVELKGSNARIHELAYQDSLTGLANRRQFLESLESGIDHARMNNESLAVFYLDLDEFKKVNDLLGHYAGDELLLIIAQRLKRCLSQDLCPSVFGDVADAQCSGQSSALKLTAAASNTSRCCIARLGGDEFIVMLPNVRSDSQALTVGRQILDTLNSPIELYDQQFIVGGSIGISLYPEHALNAGGLVKCADIAMYAVKRNTKHQACLYDQSMQQRVTDRVLLESQLRLALERDELRLVYQPQLCIRSRKTIGFEALLRWQHPEMGFVSPVQFIPVAEQTGLIDPIGAWVINEACRQWRQWHEAGLEPGRVAVNVSPAQFSLQTVETVVLDALERNQVPVQALEIEITESCMMEAPVSVVDLLKGLRQRGVRVAMDDFGTGHSSLATLATLPIDTLKIDRGFVTDVHADFARSKIMTAVLMLATELGLETLAEGVEIEEELAFLEKGGCDVVQGYLMSRPLSASDATEWLQTHKEKVVRDKAA